MRPWRRSKRWGCKVRQIGWLKAFPTACRSEFNWRVRWSRSLKLPLLDEPGAGLNTAERYELLAALKSAVGPEVTILLIEHDLGFIAELCDHILVLHFGRKIADGTLEEVKESKSVIDAYLGTGRRAREAVFAA